MKNTILLLAFIAISVLSYSQCSTCTTCTISTSSGCTWTVSSSSSTDYTINGTGNQKLCITGGAYTGNITLQGGTVVVSNSAIFNPASWTLGILDVYGGTLEIKSGVTATIPEIKFNGSTSFTFNNCGSVTMNSTDGVYGFKTNGSGTVNLNNAGTYTSTYDILLNGAGTVCNSGHLTCNNFSANGTSGSSVNNSGTMTCTGNFSQNSSCPVNICPGSKITISGDWNSNGGTTTGTGSCGAIKVNGSSTCVGCTVTGPMDFCDPNATDPSSNPTFNNCTGCTVGASVTKCTCAILPIELLSFSADKINNEIELNWITASEKNNDYFIIQRSGDAISFEDIGKVSGRGNSSIASYYKFIDNNSSLADKLFYRLKQTDFDGRYSYSDIIAISEERENLVFVYYNKKENNISISFYSEGGDALISITDVLGRILYVDSKNYSKGFYTINIPANNFGSGIVIVNVYNGSKTYFNKLLLNR